MFNALMLCASGYLARLLIAHANGHVAELQYRTANTSLPASVRRISLETASMGVAGMGFQYISPNHIIKVPIH